MEQLAETARALSPVRFFLRPTEPEEEYSSFSTFEQPSYDYQQEEEWVRAVQAKGDGKRRKKVTEEDMPYRPGSDSGSDSDARKTPSPRKNSPTPVQHIVRAITPRMSPAPRTFQPRRKPSSSRTAVTNILHGIVLALQFVVDLLGNMAKAIVSPLAGGLRRLRRDWWKWVCGLFALSLALRLGKRRPEIDLDTRIAALERGVNRNVVVDHGITRDEVRAIVKQIQEESAQPVESRIDVEEVVRRILEDQPVKTTSTDTVQQLIDKSILRYSKDTLGLADYALFTAGGRVVPSITSDTLVLKPASAVAKWLGGARDVEGRSPATALHPDNSVGNCWPFRGSQGQLGVLLSRRAVVTSVTIEHAAQELALDVSTAPRFIEVVSDMRWDESDGSGVWSRARTSESPSRPTTDAVVTYSLQMLRTTRQW